MQPGHAVADEDQRALAEIRRALLAWYDDARRDFPWRRTRDPYAVLVSEVMLQQTQASRVVGRFGAFLERFPTAASLAAAPSAELLASWSGLGYNRRALALQRAAVIVAREGWPRDVDGLRMLPGVGPYTARAIASLAFDRPVGVVDTNVRRWLIRRFALASEAPPAALQHLADGLATAGSDGRVDAWTHASMEFGAAVCRARTPACDACPISEGCPSRGMNRYVNVPRQPPFAGSDRERRGALLRALAATPGHRLSEREALDAIGGEDPGRLLAALEADGLAHRVKEVVRLGGRTVPGPTDTIGP